MSPKRLILSLLLSLGAGACATAPEPSSGFLTSYEGLVEREDSLRASIRERRNEAISQTIEAVHIEPAILIGTAPEGISPEDVKLILSEMDRQVCYEVSERFTLLASPSSQSARIRIAATRISPTGRLGSAISAGVSQFLPGPIGLRIPGTTGGFAAEAELLAADGQQAAALVFARNATVVGTDNPSLSRVGDAHQLTEVFGDVLAEAFAPQDRKVRPIPNPDPCERFGPRFRPEGVALRVVTGLYQPEASGGRSQDPAPAPLAD